MLTRKKRYFEVTPGKEQLKALILQASSEILIFNFNSANNFHTERLGVMRLSKAVL
jgi:hypothetical protein